MAVTRDDRDDNGSNFIPMTCELLTCTFPLEIVLYFFLERDDHNK